MPIEFDGIHCKAVPLIIDVYWILSRHMGLWRIPFVDGTEHHGVHACGHFALVLDPQPDHGVCTPGKVIEREYCSCDMKWTPYY